MRKIFIGRLIDTPIGTIFFAVLDQGLVAVQIGGGEHKFTQDLSNRFGNLPTRSDNMMLPFVHQIRAYLQGDLTSFNFLIDWEVMSPFQQKVQRAVASIPYGETRTYGQIATQIGSTGAARAVGRANASNPMPLVLPCHRLIGLDGSLRGYGGGEGIKTKAWLLNLEKGNRG